MNSKSTKIIGLLAMVIGAFGLVACGGAPQGGIRSVSSPSWYLTLHQGQLGCDRAKARATADEETAMTEAITRARLKAQQSLRTTVAGYLNASTKGGESRQGGKQAIAMRRAAENLVGFNEKLEIKGGKVMKAEFKRITEGYIQPGDAGFAVVCIDVGGYFKSMRQLAEADKVAQKVLAQAEKDLAESAKKMKLDQQTK